MKVLDTQVDYVTKNFDNMKKLIIYSLSILTLFFSSCTNKSDSSGTDLLSFNSDSNFSGNIKILEGLKNFYADSKSSYNIGHLSIAKTNGSSDGNFTQTMSGNSFINFKGDISIFDEKNNLIPIDNERKRLQPKFSELSKLFGTSISLELHSNPSSSSGTNFRSDTSLIWKNVLYIPKSLVVTDFGDVEQKTGSLQIVSKKNGKKLTWIPDKDSRNDKGVVIQLGYRPEYEKQFPNRSNYPSKSVDKYITTEDSGSYQLSEKDLKEFPSPLNGLEITIYRGNYLSSQTKDHKIISVISYDCYRTNIRISE